MSPYPRTQAGMDGAGRVRLFISFLNSLGRDIHSRYALRSTGTRWEGVCFRRFLLDTVPDLGPSLRTMTLVF
jgi:hypothetical protein